MEREIRRVDRPRMMSEQGDLTYLEDPVSEIMDRLCDLETQWVDKNKRLTDSIRALQNEVKSAIQYIFLSLFVAALCYLMR